MRTRGDFLRPWLVVGAGLLAGACATPSPPAASSASTKPASTVTTGLPATASFRLSGGYLTTMSNGAVFVQLTMTSAARAEGSIVYRFRYRGGLASGEAHCTGVLDSADLTLRFDKASAGWALGSSWSGFVHSIDDGITLNLPEGGRLFAAVFEPATAEDYNRALKRAGL